MRRPAVLVGWPGLCDHPPDDTDWVDLRAGVVWGLPKVRVGCRVAMLGCACLSGWRFSLLVSFVA
jgi:hypothetical protein